MGARRFAGPSSRKLVRGQGGRRAGAHQRRDVGYLASRRALLGEAGTHQSSVARYPGMVASLRPAASLVGLGDKLVARLNGDGDGCSWPGHCAGMFSPSI